MLAHQLQEVDQSVTLTELRRQTLPLLAGAAFFAALAPSAAHAQAGGAGMGKCIFSPQELPKGGEGSAAYRAAKTDFSEGEEVHIRCYWARKLPSFRAAGKVFNEIRDKNKYSYGLFWMMPGANGGPPVERMVQDMASDDAAGAMTWNQQRFDLWNNRPDCDIKVQDPKLIRDYGVTSPNRCLSLGNYIRKMQAVFPTLASERAFRFCFRQYVEVADRKATYTGRDATDPWRLRRQSTTMLDIYPQVIAQGCFTYSIGS